MVFKPPLSTAELHAIGRRHDPADRNRLLWEIKRLRAIVLRANQVFSAITTTNPSYNIVLDCLRQELKGELCLMDEEARRLSVPGQGPQPRPKQ